MKRNERKLYGKYQIYAVTKHKLTILNCTVKNQGRIYYHFKKNLFDAVLFFKVILTLCDIFHHFSFLVIIYALWFNAPHLGILL